MGGVFNDLLSLIDDGSWQYGQYKVEGTLTRGDSIETTIHSSGWLGSVTFISTDCFSTLQIVPMNRKLTLPTNISPEYLRLLQITNPQDALGGWLQMYQRFNPQSSFGSYFVALAQASPLPYVSPTKVLISLPTTSTQNSAYLSATAVVIEVVDEKQFMQSLSNLPFLKPRDAELIEVMKTLVQEIKGLKGKL